LQQYSDKQEDIEILEVVAKEAPNTNIKKAAEIAIEKIKGKKQ